MNKDLKIGDYVRNRTSGTFGCITDISPDKQTLFIQTIHNTHRLWTISNVRPIKDATR